MKMLKYPGGRGIDDLFNGSDFVSIPTYGLISLLQTWPE